MKDGRTHLDHKSEHPVDPDKEAISAVDLSLGRTGDTSSVDSTMKIADSNLESVHEEHEAVPDQVRIVVTDKGYHSDWRELLRDAIRNASKEPEKKMKACGGSG